MPTRVHFSSEAPDSPRRRRVTLPALLLLPCLLAVAASWAHAGDLLHADGTHEPVQEARVDAQGRWTGVRDGHRTVLKPGDVVVITDDAGAETVTIPATAEPPDAPGTPAALSSLKDPKSGEWRTAAERLGARPTKALLDALVLLTADPKKELRSRAITALAEQRTKEGVVAAATAVLAEKDTGLRRDAASILYAVGEILRRADAKELIQRGLADKEVMVRIAFATLSPRDLEAATAVLRTDGLKHSDHHVREQTAVELGLRGDGAGEALLVNMLARAKLPGIDDPVLMERLMTREKVEICGILGTLGTETAKAALRKATASTSESVRKAAKAALDATAAK